MCASIPSRPFYAPNGLTVCLSAEGAQAGIDLLQNGATAMDAAVASILFTTETRTEPGALAVVVVNGFGARPSGTDVLTSDLTQIFTELLWRYGSRSFTDLARYRERGEITSVTSPKQRRPRETRLTWRDLDVAASAKWDCFTLSATFGEKLMSGTGYDDAPSAQATGLTEVPKVSPVIAVDHRGMLVLMAHASSTDAVSTSVVLLEEECCLMALASGAGGIPLGPVTRRLELESDQGSLGEKLQAAVESANSSTEAESFPCVLAAAIDRNKGLLIGCAPVRHRRGVAVY